MVPECVARFVGLCDHCEDLSLYSGEYGEREREVTKFVIENGDLTKSQLLTGFVSSPLWELLPFACEIMEDHLFYGIEIPSSLSF
jgi:hypothetical protein